MVDTVQLEAAAFRRLLRHLNQERTDVQNIDLMILAGFCRNCLADWYREAAAVRGLEMTRDEAIILMVESNLQRSVILPSEKAFSYKMRLEAMRPNYLTEYFPKYIAKHGMPKMRFHDLRHSCASLLLANGVPLKQIQEWLGHSDFSTTANIYAHLDYRSKISSAQAMEQGMLLPRSDDFGSRWENVTEQGKITEPDLNPGF